jgi:hypothetical protein
VHSILKSRRQPANQQFQPPLVLVLIGPSSVARERPVSCVNVQTYGSFAGEP